MSEPTVEVSIGEGVSIPVDRERGGSLVVELEDGKLVELFTIPRGVAHVTVGSVRVDGRPISPERVRLVTSASALDVIVGAGLDLEPSPPRLLDELEPAPEPGSSARRIRFYRGERVPEGGRRPRAPKGDR